jgi:hypothetical protein
MLLCSCCILEVLKSGKCKRKRERSAL